MTCLLDFCSVTLELLPEHAAWWPAEETLLVADLHLGKGTSFRSRGMAVPAGSSRETLNRLGALLDRRPARRLVVLGDVLHERIDAALVSEFQDWLRQRPQVTVTLIRGNHDRALSKLATSSLELMPRLMLAGIELAHDQPTTGAPSIVGHWHPCARLTANRSDQLRAPVFWRRGERQLVLPAFGAFTGGQLIQAAVGDRVFAAGAHAVVEVTDLVLGRRRRR